MAKALLVCSRNVGSEPLSSALLTEIGRLITPDNIPAQPPVTARRNGVAVAVYQANGCTLVDGASVCLGALMRDKGAWYAPGAPAPDGSYALLRSGAEQIELVTDAVASRTLWYARTDKLFIASSSQRAVLAVLGGFAPNRAAFAWMLSSGTLGPTAGWDARLRYVPPRGRLVLDRATWQLHESRWELDAAHANGARADDYRNGLEHVVDDAVDRFELDYERWVLPLSGGYDSRGLLISLQRSPAASKALNTVTWGERAALDDKKSDAYIASELARQAGVRHRYFELDAAADSHDEIIQRFIVAGDGRVASITGYLDGFHLWKTLLDERVEGVIRGDEAFGWLPVQSAAGVKRTIGIDRLADFFDQRTLAGFDLPEQELPPQLEQRQNETLAAWRDRLYREFRIPVRLAALTDLKCAYVEVVNPLLAASVVSYASSLPDTLRTDKRLWRESVQARGPALAFAKHVAIAGLGAFLRDPRMLELMADELSSSPVSDLLGAAVAAFCRDATESARKQAASRRAFVGLGRLGKRYRSVARRFGFEERPNLDPLVFAFRSLIIARTCALLREDAAALERLRGPGSAPSR